MTTADTLTFLGILYTIGLVIFLIVGPYILWESQKPSTRAQSGEWPSELPLPLAMRPLQWWQWLVWMGAVLVWPVPVALFLVTALVWSLADAVRRNWI